MIERAARWDVDDLVAELGYDERFRRLWETYFAMSEAGFLEARLRDLQLVCAKPEWSGSP